MNKNLIDVTNRGDKQMKKRTKTIIATLITLVLIPTVALAALQWRGSQNVTNIKWRTGV